MRKDILSLCIMLLHLFIFSLIHIQSGYAQNKPPASNDSKDSSSKKQGNKKMKKNQGKNIQVEKKEEGEEEEHEDESLEPVENEEEGGTSNQELKLGTPDLKKGETKQGVLGGGQLVPPSFLGTEQTLPEEETEGIKEKEEIQEPEVKEEVEKAPQKVSKVPPKQVLQEPAWKEETTKFLDVTGYFRLRGNLFYRFDMGYPSTNPHIPFPRPYESRVDPRVESDYSGDKVPCGYSGDTPDWCGKHLLTGANIRFRVEPVITLSEMVKIKSQFDILDNLVLGSTPEGFASAPSSSGGLKSTPSPDPWVPISAFSGTQVPPNWRNSLTNPISVRTVWGEVLLKNIGLLKFGRMPSSWGLGLLANDGRCLDCDYGDIADRILFSTKLFDTIFAAGWDFPVSGPTSQRFYDMQGQPYDVSAEDDVSQWLGVIAYKLEKEEEDRRLSLGKPVFAGGLYYLYRKQNLSAMESESTAPGADPSSVRLVERDAWAHIGDIWLKFLIGDFRAELEFVIIGGKIGNIAPSSYTGESLNLFQFGGVLQMEHTFLDDSLSVMFESGYASGDQNVEGLSPEGGLLVQRPGSGSTIMSRDDWITSFRFDRDYHVDLILFREILGAVCSSYYFKPSVSYWFVKNHLYGKLDIIYSRASEFISTTGNDGNLGVEFDLSLTYKTKDRFSGMLQFGYLIPLDAWKEIEAIPNAVRSLDHPLRLQIVLAIEY